MLLGGHTATVNKRLVSGRAAKLKPGTIIRLGRFELRIEEPKSDGNITATLEQVEAVETNISAEDEKAVFGPWPRPALQEFDGMGVLAGRTGVLFNLADLGVAKQR